MVLPFRRPSFDRSSIDEFFSPHRQAGSLRLAAASKNSGNLFGRGASATAQTASKIAGKSRLPFHHAFASRHFETSKEHRNLTRYGGVLLFFHSKRNYFLNFKIAPVNKW